MLAPLARVVWGECLLLRALCARSNDTASMEMPIKKGRHCEMRSIEAKNTGVIARCEASKQKTLASLRDAKHRSKKHWRHCEMRSIEAKNTGVIARCEASKQKKALHISVQGFKFYGN